MRDQKYIEDLSHIKEVMNRSSRSVSLTGLSPIAAGIVGVVGAFIAYQLLFAGYGHFGYEPLRLSQQDFGQLSLILWSTLAGGLGLGLLFALLEIRKRRQHISKQHIQQMFLNLAIPLVAGGIICLVLFLNGYIGFAISLSLVFYGLALINTNKYTLGDIKSLGLLQILIGLVALWLPQHGVILWGIGFGLLHIVYGLNMQLKNKP